MRLDERELSCWKLKAMGFSAPSPHRKLPCFYQVVAPDDRLPELAENLRALDLVNAAYLKAPVEPAVDRVTFEQQTPIAIRGGPTPDLTSRQLYLEPAPGGIDARHAWTIGGGRGFDVRFIDIEFGWNFRHEDLQKNQGGVLAGINSEFVDHGTAVMGMIAGDRGRLGVTGIAPDAHGSAVSVSEMPTGQAIRTAADLLRAGDILLVEIHRPGPKHTGPSNLGYLPIEWWPDDLAAIQYAVARGLIVVEAAGNGIQNLDDPIYNQRLPEFPESWQNPFNSENPKSGALMVGAGVPPAGTHGRTHDNERARLGFSNWGSRVDCQGWGMEVTTTGYGDLRGGPVQDFWYTDQFSGTSSAAPMAAGALACLQGIRRIRGLDLITPSEAISLVRTTGTPQEDGRRNPKTQRIGNLPDLRQLITAAIPQEPGRWRKRVLIRQVRTDVLSKSASIELFEYAPTLQIAAITEQGTSNLLRLLCEAVTHQRRVDLFVSGNQVTEAILI